MIRAASMALILFVAVLVTSRSADAAAPLDEAWRWTAFTTESGLPADRASVLAQTPEGVWAITQQGLARFDGWGWNAVPLPDLGPRAIIRSVAPDGEGGLLVVADGHLFRGNASKMTRVVVPARDLDGNLNGAVPFRGGALLSVRRQAGPALWLVRFDGSSMPPETSADIPPGVHFVAETDGFVFLATESAVVASDGGPWQRVLDCPGAWPTIRRVSGAPGGRHLLALQSLATVRGLWSWAPGMAAERVAEEGVEDVVALALAHDGDAVVSYSSGLLRWRHEGSWRTLEGSWPMLREALWLLYAPDGSLWSSTHQGVYRARATNSPWSVPSADASVGGRSINGLMRSNEGSLWLATSNGLVRHHPDGRAELISEAAGVNLGTVTSVTADRDGLTWVTSGSSFEGALAFDGQDWARVLPAEGSPPTFIHRVTLDAAGRALFLALRLPGDAANVGAGVLREQDGKLVPWEFTDRLPSQRVFALAVGESGDLWFATRGGLTRVRDGVFTTWGAEAGLKALRIFDLTLDAAGQPWFVDQSFGVGTLGADGSIRYIGSADGLPSDEAWSLAFDRRGRLWVTTTAGLACIDRDTVWALGKESGLPFDRTWPLLVERAQVVVGTLGAGLAILNLDRGAEPPPRVVIESVVASTESSRVSWRALSWQGLVPPSAIETRHRIDDGPWSRWSRERSADVPLRSEPRVIEVEAKPLFPGAAPGHASRRLDLTLPWYLQAWFRLLEIIGALAALALVIAFLVRRRRQAADLRHSEARFRLLASVVTEGIAVVEARGRILDANRALGDLLGRSAVGLVGSELAAILGTSVPEPGAAPAEVIVRRPGGEERVAEIVARAHQWRGHGATVVVLRDVTERKDAEAARLEMELRLRRAHELESLGLLAGRIAHDFNNVLMAVIGNQDLAAERVSDPIAREHLEQSRVAARQAADLSHQMLAASGRGRLVVCDVDLSAHVQQMAEFLKVMLPKGIRITRELAHDLPAIEADPTQLSQLILNLVTNASDAIGERGGTIHLRTALTDSRDAVVLEVRDDGVGIDHATHQRLFEPFFTTRPDGRGLGLATVAAVAKTHGAVVEVESAPGAGATFRVTFRATDRRASASVLVRLSDRISGPAARSEATLGLGLVLVVDDEPTVRTLTVAMVRRLGGTVIEACDGEEALGILAERGGELAAAVLDLTMPRASGLDVLAAIRQSRAQLPVLLVTGYSSEDVAASITGDRFTGVLAKPYTAAELRDALAAVGAGSGGVGP